MVFHRAEVDDPHFFMLWKSETDQWRLGFHAVMFGVRVALQRVDAPSFITLDYCAGADAAFQQELMRVMQLALLPYQESITERELQDIFPRYTKRPICWDPVCWPELQRMAEAAVVTACHKTA